MSVIPFGFWSGGYDLISSNRIFYYDPANSASYPGTGTTIFDLSGNGNNGTFINNVTFDPNDAGGALNFPDASSSYIQLPSAVADDMVEQSFTIEAWLKPFTFPPTNQVFFSIIQSILNNSFTQILLHCRFVNTGLLRFAYFGNDLDTIQGVGTFGDWQHIVMRYRSSDDTSTIFKNGIQKAQNNAGPLLASTNRDVEIGRFNNAEYWKGNIGMIQAYQAALTDEEIVNNYNALKSRYIKPILHWDAGNSSSYPGSGTTIQDLSDNNYDGTLNGVVYNSSDSGKFVLVNSEQDWINSSGTNLPPASVGTGDFSLEIWCKLPNANQQGYLLSNRSSSSGDRFSLHVGTVAFGGSFTDSKRISLVFYVNAIGYSRELLLNSDVADGNWKHIIVTRSASNFTFYINGVSSAFTTVRSTGSGIPNLNTSTTWRIGDSGSGNGAESIDADVSIVRMHTRALTSAEALEQFNLEKSRYGL